MTKAEVCDHPGLDVLPAYMTTGADRLTVTDDPSEEKRYSAAEVLGIVLAAYAKGIDDGRGDSARERWSMRAESFRAARIRTETSELKRLAGIRYERFGYPSGYDYRGGPVDWETGLPEGSGCAWLRQLTTRGSYGLAGGR